MRSLGLMMVVAPMLVIAGCGGDDASDSNNVTTDETTMTTTESSSGSSSGGSESSTATTNTTTDTSSSSSASGSSSSESSTAADSASSSESGTGGPDGVACFFAPAPCEVGQVCCSDQQEGTALCQVPDAECQGVVVECDGTEDCGGQLCCGTNDGGTQCADSCEGYHICHVDGECNDGESCCPNGGGDANSSFDHCTTLQAGRECPQPP